MQKQIRAGVAAFRLIPAALVIVMALWLGLCTGCVATGKVETSGADLLDLLAGQTATTLTEYERDLQTVDTDRQHAVVQCLVDRVKRDGADKIDLHAAALQQALDKIAADRQVARRRYEAAMDNVALIREVSGGLRRYGQRLATYNATVSGQ